MEKTPQIIIKEILESLAVPFSDIEEESVAGQLVYQIKTDEASRLIGMHGDTIRALDYLVKKIHEQNAEERQNFVVDVNQYQVARIKDIEMRAKMMAERARSFEYDVEMPPMSAYERLIVHASLTDEPNVSTESQGEGRERRVVIRFANTREV